MTPHEALALNRLATHQGTPDWAREILTASATPNVSSTSSTEVEAHTIDPDYLKFLREQIDLAPRGPEWSSVLVARLGALQPFVGQPMLRIGVHRGATVFIGHLRASDLEVIHTEEFS
jgi:hypothetical protein